MKVLITSSLFFLLLSLNAQKCKDTSVIYTFAGARFVYPQAAMEAQVGGTVFIKFNLDSTCSLVNRKVIKGIGYGCDEEAMRSFDQVEERLKKEHKSRCCPMKDITIPVKFKIQ